MVSIVNWYISTYITFLKIFSSVSILGSKTWLVKYVKSCYFFDTQLQLPPNQLSGLLALRICSTNFYQRKFSACLFFCVGLMEDLMRGTCQNCAVIPESFRFSKRFCTETMCWFSSISSLFHKLFYCKQVALENHQSFCLATRVQKLYRQKRNKVQLGRTIRTKNQFPIK